MGLITVEKVLERKSKESKIRISSASLATLLIDVWKLQITNTYLSKQIDPQPM